MKQSELDALSLKQLNDLKQRVDRMVDAKHDTERNELHAKFKSMAEQAGFSLGEIVGTVRAAKGRPGGSKGKAAAKYANPQDRSQTWSGRGRMPNWLSARVKAGEDAASYKL